MIFCVVAGFETTISAFLDQCPRSRGHNAPFFYRQVVANLKYMWTQHVANIYQAVMDLLVLSHDGCLVSFDPYPVILICDEYEPRFEAVLSCGY